jgi:CPA2 family monovalent cation:H+ antiporter-2
MHNLPIMIHDLALILGTAAIVTLIFKRLKQPLVLGYLVAGFLVSPKTHFFPTVIGVDSINLWAEMGVIFLLFALGLEFSFKKLLRVGGASSITALIEVSMMMGAGYLTGQLLGWSSMDSLFLGGILSISSTSIILRTVDELGFKNMRFVGMVFGVLIVEDLVAVLLMVLLTTVALTRDFAGFEMLGSILKLAFFLAIWFVTGIFVLPSFLKRAQKLLNEETVLVAAVGLCLLMVVFASDVGFSSALGAFVTGSILAETVEGERINHLVQPIKNLFSAVFFISVGMLIDPSTIIAHWNIVLLLSLVVIFGKTFSVTIGSLLAGQNLRSSIQSGMSLGQIGEFSFIIATVGLKLKVVSETLYPLAVAVSVITAFSTPYMMKSADSVYLFVDKYMPEKMRIFIERYNVTSLSLASNREWRDQVRAYLIKVVLNSVIVIAVFLLMARVCLPFLMERQVSESMSKLLSLSGTLILTAPFLWAIAFGRSKNLDALMLEQGQGAHSYVFLSSRILISVGLLGAMVAQFVSVPWALAITAWMLVVVGYILSQKLQNIYHWFEGRFLSNFHDESEKIHPRKPERLLAPWDAHITDFRVPPEAPYVGQLLSELSIREKYGVTIAMIERGKMHITAPGRYERLMPYDVLSVIGTDEQLSQFKAFVMCEHEEPVGLNESHLEYSLEAYELTEQSACLNSTIRDSGLREKTQGLVVGIERQGKRILNPDSSEILQLGDLLWIVGDREKISQLP